MCPTRVFAVTESECDSFGSRLELTLRLRVGGRNVRDKCAVLQLVDFVFLFRSAGEHRKSEMKPHTSSRPLCASRTSGTPAMVL